jgi:predicted ABC-type ATPase
MPVLTWIFGPNGAGKTTIASDITGVEHINVDTVLLEEIKKTYPSLIGNLKKNPTEWHIQDTFLILVENSIDKALDITISKIDALIFSKNDFSVESNFLPSNNEPILMRAIAANYSLNFIYLALPNIEWCAQRVMERTVVTGQFVPRIGIIDRFNKGIKDINELLDKNNKLPYKDKIKNISVLFSENDTELHELIWIQNGETEYVNIELSKKFDNLIYSLKQYY